MLMPLARGISMLMPDAPNFFPYCICMYIAGDQRAVIDFGAGKRAFQEIDKNSVEVGILTHNHPDHTHSSVLFTNTKFYAGQEEAESFRDQMKYRELRGINFWERFMKGKPLPESVQMDLKNDDIPVAPGFVPIDLAGTLTDGMQFDLGRGIKFTAVHLPGHSSGHYGFYFEKYGILFAADIDTTRGGPWYGDACSHVGQFIASVQRIKDINPAVFASSHRRPLTENIRQSLDAYLQVMLDREKQIYDLLKVPHTLEQLAEYRLAFQKRIFQLEDLWERIYVHHHLQHLLELHAIAEVDAGIFMQV